MIDISEIVNDPDFAQSFSVLRSVGSFDGNGKWSMGTPATLSRYGVIQPSKQNDIVLYVPEGERIGEMITVYCSQDILMSDAKNQQSDIIVKSDGAKYRVAYSKPWQQHGYWFAIAVGFSHAS